MGIPHTDEAIRDRVAASGSGGQAELEGRCEMSRLHSHGPGIAPPLFRGPHAWVYDVPDRVWPLPWPFK